jgi:hypothetical protein
MGTIFLERCISILVAPRPKILNKDSRPCGTSRRLARLLMSGYK